VEEEVDAGATRARASVPITSRTAIPQAVRFLVPVSAIRPLRVQRFSAQATPSPRLGEGRRRAVRPIAGLAVLPSRSRHADGGHEVHPLGHGPYLRTASSFGLGSVFCLWSLTSSRYSAHRGRSRAHHW
jgi:hypothetical protein